MATEFGIIDIIDETKEYTDFEPEKYDCVSVDDDIYINDWWEELSKIDTCFFSVCNPQKGLNRWGITLIPPGSLESFLKIVENDPRIREDCNLYSLSLKIRTAIKENKYMIHFGV